MDAWKLYTSDFLLGIFFTCNSDCTWDNKRGTKWPEELQTHICCAIRWYGLNTQQTSNKDKTTLFRLRITNSGYFVYIFCRDTRTTNHSYEICFIHLKIMLKMLVLVFLIKQKIYLILHLRVNRSFFKNR